MIIGVVGKGGSGKTTLSALLARRLSRDRKVLAIDADINQHLGRVLGYSGELPSLKQLQVSIKSQLAGSNTRIEAPTRMMKTTPPGRGSYLPRLQDESFWDPISYKLSDTLRIMATGELDEDDRGTACFHGHTGVVELLLSHINDDGSDTVIVDMTAGSDAFSSGIFTKFDMTLLIVEPSHQSLDVFRQFTQLGEGFDIGLRAVGNKVEDQGDVDFIRTHTGGAYLTHVPYDRAIRKVSQVSSLADYYVTTELNTALDTVISAIESQFPNPRRRYEHTVAFHKMNAEKWMNQRFQYDFLKQIDKDFMWPIPA